MRLTVVGCSGTYPGPDSACSSYLVEHDGYKLLLDMGNGALGSLQRFTDPRRIDAVLVSHLHGDHCLDLVTNTYARQYHPDGPLPPLPLYGPTFLRERIERSFDPPRKRNLETVYEFHERGEGRLELGPFTIDLARVEHPIECLASRIEAGGRKLVFSADTGPSEALVTLARDADLFLCEASYLEGKPNPPGVHMTGAEAALHATKASARRLVLTHLVPWYDRLRVLEDASESYDGALECAITGAVYEV